MSRNDLFCSLFLFTHVWCFINYKKPILTIENICPYNRHVL